MNHDCSTKAAFLCTVVKLQSCHMLAHWIQHTEPSPPFNQHSLENKVWLFYEVLSIENNPWAGLGRILAVACATAEKHWCLQRPASVGRLSWENLSTTIRLQQPCKELVPWQRTPWHWSKHLKFRPIMTVPQRLSFSAQLTNSNVGPCCHVMAHIGACWHSIFSTLHSLGQ